MPHTNPAMVTAAIERMEREAVALRSAARIIRRRTSTARWRDRMLTRLVVVVITHAADRLHDEAMTERLAGQEWE